MLITGASRGIDAARLGAAGKYIDSAAAKGAIDSMPLGLAKEVAAGTILWPASRPSVPAVRCWMSAADASRNHGLDRA